MEWTTNTPTQEGWYWVYRGGYFDDEKVVDCISISFLDGGEIWIDKNFYGYECDTNFEVKDISHWQGPITPPMPPTMEMMK